MNNVFDDVSYTSPLVQSDNTDVARNDDKYESFPIRMRLTNMGRRSCIESPTFFQWKGYSLTPSEKLWLCEQADERIPTTSDIQERSKKGLIRRYGLYEKFFRNKNWEIYLDSKRKFHDRSGAPESIGEPQLVELGRDLERKNMDFDKVPSTLFRKMLKTQQDETRVSRGLETTPGNTVSKSFYQAFIKRHKVIAQTPDLPTEASDIACHKQTIIRYGEEKLARDPENIRQQRKFREAEKLIEVEATKQEMIARKNLEILRISNLNPEDKAKDTLAKKAASDDKATAKRKRDDDHTIKMSRAHSIVNNHMNRDPISK